jgi:hypothetical protein
MADSVKFCCDIDTTNAESAIGLEVLFDGSSVFCTKHVQGVSQISFDINDDEAVHRLEFVMTGKSQAHTVVDNDGNIVSDTLLKISNIQVDDIILDHLLVDLTKYTHDYNGTKETTSDKFYGLMGCNGTVTFEFTTPFYLWLLENM